MITLVSCSVLAWIHLSFHFLQVVHSSKGDVLYFQLLADMALVMLCKILANHNLDALSHLGHMSSTACFVMFVLGQGIDFIIMFYILDSTFVRYLQYAA